MKNKIEKCVQCQKFVGKKGRATVKEPTRLYCSKCYDKGYQEELEAMGAFDSNYFT